MLKMKKCMIPAILAAMALSVMTGCGGKDKDAGAAAETTTEAAEATETTVEETEETEAGTEAEAKNDDTVSEYLEQVDTMNKAAEEFITISMEFMELAQNDAENTEALTESIEKTRATKQAFADFSVLDNPPEGLEEAHARLAEAAKNYADTLEVYCDVLLASINGEEHEAMATIQDDWTNVATELSEAMGAVEEAAADLQ